MREIYPMFFKHFRLLPDALGRQNPWVLFDMLDRLDDGENEKDEKNEKNEKNKKTDFAGNDHLKMLYDV